MSVAGDRHHVWPVVGLHDNPGGVGAGHVEGGGTPTARALDASAGLTLSCATLAAIDAPLGTKSRTKPGVRLSSFFLVSQVI